MDASISEIDGALSPIFLSKQILLELEDVKTNLATHKNNFSKFSADSLDQIYSSIIKFDDKMKKLVDAIENQTSEQEEKFVVQKDKLLSLSSEITNLKVRIAQVTGDQDSMNKEEEMKRRLLINTQKEIESLEAPIKTLEVEIKPLLESRSNVEDSLMEIRNEFSELSEEIRSLERASHDCDLNAEKIRQDSQDSKINRQGYLSEAEIYLKQLEKDGLDIKA